MTGPRIAILDIETSPAVVESWSLHNAFISIDQIREPSAILGIGYKWHGSSKVGWISTQHHTPLELAEQTRDILHAADIVVTYNGDSFDLRHLKRDILMHDLAPPAPSKSVDLYRTIKRHFKFQSNKLGFVAAELGVGQKASTGGYELWKGCMSGDPGAWAKMGRYCRQDVKVTEALYDRLLPWITTHPNIGLWSDAPGLACPTCGSHNMQRRGLAVTLAATYQRFQCQACATWARGTRIERKAAGETRRAG